MMRLEQLTYDEASAACKVRGGHLAHVKSIDELNSLRSFSDRRELGIGLRAQGASEWHFDGVAGESAKQAIKIFKKKYGEEFTRTGCIRLRHRGALLASLDCNAKFDWVCEGTLENTLSQDVGIVASNDLKADEGAFCLWNLPNDEGNTDLNVDHYPVEGSSVGWKGAAANETFLSLDDANDHFHCHYSPSNSGLLRMFALQHMYELNYPGALKQKCGCGYKFLSNLVSKCDCTRSGKANNGCAKWHSTLLTRATQEKPVT